MVNYSYLQRQCLFLEVNASAFFTEEEENIFKELIGEKSTEEVREIRSRLTETIAKNKEPRFLNLSMVVNNKMLEGEEHKNYYTDDNGEIRFHWNPMYLKPEYIRVEFASSCFQSELTRNLGYTDNEFIYDLVKIKWNSFDIMQQIIEQGVRIKWMINNEIKVIEYSFSAASAGDMRTKKFLMISTAAKNKVYPALYNGITDDIINSKGGICVSKYLAYKSLAGSATEVLKDKFGNDFSIRKVIVVPDFTLNLDLYIDFIQADSIKRGWCHDVLKDEKECGFIERNVTDGAGICLPGVLPYGSKNSIIRSCFIKGTINEFNFIEFCEVNNVPCKATDIYGTEHDLIAEGIEIILTESEFKLAGYWDNWSKFCDDFEKNGCKICIMMCESGDINDYNTQNNYQYVQCVTELTDEDIETIIAEPIKSIESITSDKRVMLNILGADLKSDKSESRCLALYPPLIKNEYFRNTLVETKNSKIRHLKSSTFDWNSKRVFILPDLYAFCQRLFLHQEKPTGLIGENECVWKPGNPNEEVAILRSPQLFIDGVILTVKEKNTQPPINNPYYWMNSQTAIYTSAYSGLYLSINADWDGDTVAVVREHCFVEALKRTIEKYKIVTPYYRAMKAPKQQISSSNIVKTLQIAEKFNIGKISNYLTKLWNNPEFIKAIDNNDEAVIEKFITAGKFLLLKNQGEIDGGKTGKSLELSEHVNKLIEQCIGTKQHPVPLPHFFQHTDNFKGQIVENNWNSKQINNKVEKMGKSNNSVCNKICGKIEEKFKKYKEFDFSDFDSFDYRIFFREEPQVIQETIDTVVGIFKSKNSVLFNAKKKDISASLNGEYKQASPRENYICNLIIKELNKQEIEYRSAYESMVLYLFRNNFNKRSYVKLFFLIFGKTAEENIKYNIKNNTYTEHEPDIYQTRCAKCGKIIPKKQTYCEDCIAEATYERRKHGKPNHNINTNVPGDTLKVFLRNIFKVKQSVGSKLTFKKIAEAANAKFGTQLTEAGVKASYHRRKFF